MKGTARVYELGDRGREAVAKRERRDDSVPVKVLTVAEAEAKFTIAPYVTCPCEDCGAAADKVNKPEIPFRGIECHWCGCCFESNGNGAMVRSQRRIRAIEVHRTLSERLLAEPGWGAATRLIG